MEDGLVPERAAGEQYEANGQVLILVVMEDGLVREAPILVGVGFTVLILVVMEDGLVRY